MYCWSFLNLVQYSSLLLNLCVSQDYLFVSYGDGLLVQWEISNGLKIMETFSNNCVKLNP
jgi:hypothetical protein